MRTHETGNPAAPDFEVFDGLRWVPALLGRPLPDQRLDVLVDEAHALATADLAPAAEPGVLTTAVAVAMTDGTLPRPSERELRMYDRCAGPGRWRRRA